MKVLFIYFILTSVLGYIYECSAMTLWSGRWDNRGFLFGPSIPIYGVGCLLGLVFGEVIHNYTYLQVFFAGFLVSALLEYPTSVVLEKVFHERWWDYSIAPFNINGRVSLLSSLGFGIGALLIVYVINPLLLPLLYGCNPLIISRMSVLFMAIFLIDVFFSAYCNRKNITVNSYEKMNERIGAYVEKVNPDSYSLFRFLNDKTHMFKEKADH